MIRPMKDSGMEWIGAIPENWKNTQLRIVFTERKNQNFEGKEQNLLSLSYGKIKRKDIKSNFGLLPSSFNTYNIIEKDDVIIRGTDLQNDTHSLRTGISNEHGIITSAYIDLAPRNDVNARFFHFLLYSYDIAKVFYSMGGGVRQSLKYDDLKMMRVIVPPVYEQNAIVAYLNRQCAAIDDTVTATKASIEKLKEYKAALITRAVTTGLNPNAEMKRSNKDWIERMPAHWKFMRTKYLFEILKRIAGKKGYDILAITQQGLKVKDISNNEGQIAADYSKYQLVYPGDFAMNHMDLLTGWMDLSDKMGVTSPDYRVFRKCSPLVYDKYYRYVFQNLYTTRVYYGLAQGVAEVGRKRLQAPTFRNFKLPVPPLDEQKAIVAYLDKETAAIDRLIAQKQQLIEKFTEYKQSLIYAAVTGKIDCREEASK